MRLRVDDLAFDRAPFGLIGTFVSVTAPASASRRCAAASRASRNLSALAGNGCASSGRANSSPLARS